MKHTTTKEQKLHPNTTIQIQELEREIDLLKDRLSKAIEPFESLEERW